MKTLLLIDEQQVGLFSECEINSQGENRYTIDLTRGFIRSDVFSWIVDAREFNLYLSNESINLNRIVFFEFSRGISAGMTVAIRNIKGVGCGII